MSSTPQPLAFQFTGPGYAPVLMLPLDPMANEYLTGSGALDGTSANALTIPSGSASVFIESLGSEIRFRGKKVTAADTTKPSSGAPGSDVSDGSAGGWLPAGAAQTYSLLDSQGQPAFTHLSLKSAGGVRLTFNGGTK